MVIVMVFCKTLNCRVIDWLYIGTSMSHYGVQARIYEFNLLSAAKGVLAVY